MAAEVEGYDTDTISLTSTAPAETGEYLVEDVLAEKIMEDGEPRYLIKWHGYGLEECTWEPYEHAEPILDESWEQKIKNLTKDQLEKHIADNERRFNEAFIAAQDATALRKEKRARRRQRMHHQSGVEMKGVEGKIDSDRLLNRRNSTMFSRTSEEHTEDSVFERETRQPQKAHLLQSSSFSSEGSEDSMMEELKAERTKQSEQTGMSKPIPTAPSETSDGKIRKDSISRPTEQQENPGKAANSTSITAAAHGREKRRVGTEENASATRGRMQKISINTAVDQVNSVDSSSYNLAGSNRSPISPLTAPPTTAPFARRDASGSTYVSTGPIRMVNKTPTEQRKQWHNGGRQYHTMSMRRNAELRSRDEQAPDISVLQFPNGAPTGFPVQAAPIQETRESRPNENVYGRRESGRRRDRDGDVEERSENSPEAWETTKPPLTCWEWRNGSCWFPPERCQFRHEDGYALAPTDGIMPPKYRPKPVTCYYFMMGLNGCAKTAEDCSYAHYNTGLLAIQEQGRRHQTIQIDKSKLPKFEEAIKNQLNKAEFLPRRNKSELTCYFWHTNRSCRRGEACEFAHAYTGEIARAPGKFVQNRWDNAATPIIETSLGVAPVASQTQPFASNPVDSEASSPITTFEDPPMNKASDNLDLDCHTSTLTINNDCGPAHCMIVPSQTVIATHKPLAVQIPTKLLCVELKNIIEDVCKIDFQTIFSSFGGREEPLDRRAFLFFHPEYHMEELELITRWLLLHHVEVGNLWSNGSWDHYRNSIREGGSGVIITHPEFQRFWQVPGFSDILRGYVRIWSVGYQLPLECDLQTPGVILPPQQDCIEIFPRGGIIYITDDVFEQKPIEALRLVAAFVRQVDICRTVLGPVDPWKRVNDGCLLWRLAVRPGLMQTTYDWCIKHEAEVEAKDPAAQSRVQLYNLLSDCNYIEHDQDPSEPYVTLPDDFWPIISEREIVSDAYYEALKRSQMEANSEQVSLYAGTVVELRSLYRQYFVVHPEPNKVDWKSRWLHLDEVLTPEKCIEYLEQPSAKGNRIDFQSWRFPEKPAEAHEVASPETPAQEGRQEDRSTTAGSPMVFSESE